MEKTKLIIFDMDGTLYDMADMAENNYEISVSYLQDRFHHSEEEAKALLQQNRIYPYPFSGAGSSTQLFVQMGADLRQWNEYRSPRFDYRRIRKENAAGNDVLRFFKKIAPIVLLTNNTTGNTLKVLDQIGLDISLFDRLQCNDSPRSTVSKTSAMKQLIDDFHIRSDAALSIGDRYSIDAKPMLELGGKAIIIRDPSSFNKIMKDYPQLKSCKEYTCYFPNSNE